MSRRWLLDQAASDRDGARLGAVGGTQLLEDPLQVGLHGVGAYPEVVGDLPRGGAVGDLLEDLLLALGQRRRVNPLLRELDLLDEGPRQLRVEHGLTLER